MTKPIELRKLTVHELDEKAKVLRRQLFIFRTQHAGGQLAKTAQVKLARRELARVLTLAGEKRREEARKS